MRSGAPVHPTPNAGHQDAIVRTQTLNKTIHTLPMREECPPALPSEVSTRHPVPIISTQLPTAHAVKIKKSIPRGLMSRGGLCVPVGPICRSTLTPSPGRCGRLSPQPTSRGNSATSQESVGIKNAAVQAGIGPLQRASEKPPSGPHQFPIFARPPQAYEKMLGKRSYSGEKARGRERFWGPKTPHIGPLHLLCSRLAATSPPFPPN